MSTYPPKSGTYESPRFPDFTFQITQATPDNGQIKGVYSAPTPEGQQENSGVFGHYSFVREVGETPFCIKFEGVFRGNKMEYCIYDTITGVYKDNNVMTLTAVRSSVDKEGKAYVGNLFTDVEFYLEEEH